jgi:hypothetical protein
MIIKKGRTKAYIGTVNLSDPGDLDIVKSTRRIVKQANEYFDHKERSTRLYIKLQGRGPRLGNRNYNQSLPLKYSLTADIYIYNRHS